MLRAAIVAIVGFSARRPWVVIALALTLAAASAAYSVRHFAIKTDVTDLFPADLPWTARAFDFMKTFPQQSVLVVVDAATPEFAEAATGKLADALAARTDVIRAVRQADSGHFFAQNGLLFLPTDEVARVAGGLLGARSVLETLSQDPSLRGSLAALSFGLLGVDAGGMKLDDLARPMTLAADTAAEVLAGRQAAFSWRALASGQQPEPRELRHFIEVDPVLDFSALQPGRKTTAAIAQSVRDLNLAGDYQARVRQTGLVPIDDDQFATIKKHMGRNTAISLVAVFVILWLALRSARIIVPVAISVAAGLAISAAFGLILVGALNLISVAFFVLFVGLGVDFGIQFSVRYRAERHEYGTLRPALVSTARKAGGPLALAAAATAVGFGSFLPTAYRGLSELGEIAGSGMIIAFLTSITLLPALIAVMRPPEEPRPMGFAALTPVDRFLARRRLPVVVLTVLAVLAGAPLLLYVRFDFNPLHLRNADSESVATYLELRKDPQTGANAIEIVARDLTAAEATATRVAALPQVSQTRTLQDFVPADQDQKLQLIHMAAAAIGPALNPETTEPAPTDQQEVEALTSTASLLAKLAANKDGPGAEAAQRLSGLLQHLATAEPSRRAAAEAAVGKPLRIALADLREQLKAQPVTPDTVPPDLKSAWVAADGRARVQVLPKGDPDDTANLRQFATAVLAAEPQATGPAVMLFEAGNTVVHAFVIAGIFALSAIALLLWIALRRIGDVLLTLVPLLVAGIVTLELSVVIGLPLNFANIIALPLLLGVGVAFKIYYIMAWRRGKTALVQSTLSRAVIFSAMTTATAFGSLWLSADPGTSSMGQLMALALLCTMAAAVLFQPALMGPPRVGPPRAADMLAEEWDEEPAVPRRRRIERPVHEPVGR
jgi:hopanoid biosynthesis associated RND transporter like protein HpnN